MLSLLPALSVSYNIYLFQEKFFGELQQNGDSCNQRISSSRHGRCLREDKAKTIVRLCLPSI